MLLIIFHSSLVDDIQIREWVKAKCFSYTINSDIYWLPFSVGNLWHEHLFHPRFISPKVVSWMLSLKFLLCLLWFVHLSLGVSGGKRRLNNALLMHVLGEPHTGSSIYYIWRFSWMICCVSCLVFLRNQDQIEWATRGINIAIYVCAQL